MKKHILKSTSMLMLFVLIGLTSPSQSSPKATFTLKITQVQDPKATLHVGFYRVTNDFPTPQKHAFAKSFVPGKTGDVTVRWDDIEPGEYAFAIYQDVDNSGKLESNLFGYPKEPFAFSQNFKPTLRKPNFDKCKISFTGSTDVFEVELIN